MAVQEQVIREPARIARLPHDKRGRPVPWFVAWIDGEPDFRVIGPGKIQRAVLERLCWMCGSKLTRHAAFVIGPMCAVNRVSAEPPCHTECAEFAATHCPFLTKPRMRRREKGLPETVVEPAGQMIRRNPGVVLLWVTRSWTLEREGDGVLFRIGDPAETRWFAEGRPATRAEVETSITSGLPILLDMAEQERDSSGAVEQLNRQVSEAMTFLPMER